MSKLKGLSSVGLGLIPVFLLVGCLKSTEEPKTEVNPDGTTGTTTDTGGTNVKLAGIVSAPGGTVAFNPPSGVNKFFASIFGGNAVASLTGTSVVSGATVDLVEIDEAGAQVGSVLSTAMTDATGAYSLELPDGFAAASNFVVRATGSSSESMDAVVTTIDESIDVDPVSHATRALIVSALQAKTDSKLSDLKLSEVVQMASEVRGLEHNLDLSGATNINAFVSAFKTEAANNEEVNNIINSTLEAGEICGSVKDSTGAALKNIVVVARDYGNWVTRAKIKTDDSGDYCLNVPPNKDYILGALNYTGASTAGSEWWTCADTETSTCGTAVQLDAEKISVAETSVTKDFVLEPGVRVAGTITTEDTSAPLKRVHVMFRTYDGNIATVAKKTKSDGTYRINMRPGVYKLFARNATRQKFATEAYNPDLNGGLNFREAKKMDLSESALLGTTISADFSLSDGFPVSGILTDANNVAISGARVHFRQNGTVNVRRTNKEGKFRMQLRPGRYSVLSHGQRKSVMIPRDLYNADNVYDVADMPLTFNAEVGKVKVKVMQGCDANGANGTPVSQAKALLFKTSSQSKPKLFAAEPTNADGTSNLHIDTGALNGGGVRFVVRVDDGKYAGSIVYAGANAYSTKLGGGENLRPLINADANKTHDLGEVCLPEGGIVSGIVKNTAGQPLVNAVVQVLECASGCSGNFMVATRTNIEGKYKVSLPAGMVAGIRVQTSRVNGAYSSVSTPVTVVANETNTVNLDVAMTEPLGIIGIAGDTQATIKWKPVLGAATYNVYMSNSAGVTTADTLVGSPTDNKITLDTLTNDTTYYYVVTAVDANSNESDISEEIAITPSATATGN